MSGAAARIFKAVKAHVPMIKFRKGSLIPKSAPVLPESTVAPAMPVANPASSGSKQWDPEQVVQLEWWQTPDKFKRRNLEELECDLINSGGADRVYH